MTDALLTPSEVAAVLAVSPVTVRQWAQKGLIEARTTPGGHRRFTRDAVIDFARRMAMTLPDGFDAPPGDRVLIVDADRQVAETLTVLFGRAYPSVAVTYAGDAFEAGRQLSRVGPTLLLLDVSMPGMDAMAACRAVKADDVTRAVRIVAMCSYPTPEMEQRVLAAGAERLLRKPIGLDELLAACGLAVSPPAPPGV